jgi:RNA polymerase sigma factor (TIGR02999 family)
MSEVTRIMAQIESGDPQAAEQLLPLVYDELRRLARLKLSQEKPGHTLQPTALVHEVYLRLVGDQASEVGDRESAKWDSRGHFFSAAAEAMRRILVDSARRRRRLKRGLGQERQALDEDAIVAPEVDGDLIELDAALEQLAAKEPRIAELVKLRYFAGLTNEQAAQALGVSITTANRDWSYARAWLFRAMTRGNAGDRN